MELIQKTPDLSAYLAADEVIDHDHPYVREVAGRLAKEAEDSYAYARLAFEFVRDTVPITQPVPANAVFAILEPEHAARLREDFFFYTWDEATGEVRWMCSWDTTEDDVDAFAAAVRG